MNQSRDPHVDEGLHLDEDLLAAWILEGETAPNDSERGHLDDCPVCSKRVAALRRLGQALEDLDLRTAPQREMEIPPRLSARELSRRSVRGNRAWALAGLATAAVLAFVVPRVTSEARLTWTDPRTAGLIGERAVAVLAELSPAVADSVVVEMVARGVAPTGNRDAGAVQLLDVDERETLFMLIQNKLEGKRSLDVQENGGGI